MIKGKYYPEINYIKNINIEIIESGQISKTIIKGLP